MAFVLQQQVKDWESYEGEKGKLLTYLKKAEVELEKPLETLNQESAQKDFTSKKVKPFTDNKVMQIKKLFISNYSRRQTKNMI